MNGANGRLTFAELYLDRRVMVVALLGFSSGLPLLLVFSTLSFWLKDAGVSIALIGAFSLARMPYTFKFAWAPLLDRAAIPWLTPALGKRRSWALVIQSLLLLSILAMGQTDPSQNLWLTAALAALVSFFSASQDVVIDAYRIESLDERRQGAGAGTFTLGYRAGMLTSGAGALWLATVFSWGQVYALMAALAVVGMVTILLSPEPRVMERPPAPHGAWLETTFIAPFRDFLTRNPRWPVILLFIPLYKLGDAYLGAMANPFYVEMGFDKTEIAEISKVYGTLATIAGGIIGGWVVGRIGIINSLLICGTLQAASNLVYVAQTLAGRDLGMLMLTISVENVTGGMASSSFVAYLSSLCGGGYTASQYALLSALMAFSRDALSSTSGVAVETMGWSTFFMFTAALALPGLALALWLAKTPAVVKQASS